MRACPGLKAGASISETLRIVAQTFRTANIEEPDVDARSIIGNALHLDRTRLAVQADRILEAREIAVISALAARRLRHEPVSRIVGQKEFWSLPITITPDVLVPRPETETVVEAALAFIARGGPLERRLRILDIGTGSGALLFALLHELPQARGIGTDASAAALIVARSNAAHCGLQERSSFVACSFASAVQGVFDVVVSNPPYIATAQIATLAPEVREYDPRLALDGGPDGLDAYRAIAEDAERILSPDGMLFVELGAGQEKTVSSLFAEAGLAVRAARNDLAGIPRVLGAKTGP
ncbi:MAG TPA: peptide chain release factor N(5)-glutamine methyltransferase [Pseudolabrys sp.]|nr:peptide chain release factor N(5)-glutamine methyltransferase [Pseudolabrys sp.]